METTPLTQTATPMPRALTAPWRRILTHQPVASYFALAFAGAWLTTLPLVLSQTGLGLLPVTLPTLPFLILGALAGPTLAAFAVTGATEGRAGMQRLLRRYILWRVDLSWYLLACAGPLLVLTLGASVFFGGGPLLALSHRWPLLVTVYLPIIPLGAILGGPLWEEGGWRGVALPRLQRQVGPLMASLILGALWGLWHLPGFLGGWLGPFTLPSFVGLILAAMGFSVIVTWVYNHTRGSILLAILLHGASNAASNLGGKLLPVMMPHWMHVLVYASGIPVLAYGVCAALLIVCTKGQLGYQPDWGSRPPERPQPAARPIPHA